MFNEEEQAVGLGGITVKDAWIGLQLLDKAAANGVLQPQEFTVLGEWRQNMTQAIQRAIGKNYDEELAKVRQAQIEMARQQQAAQQANAGDAPEAETEEQESVTQKPKRVTAKGKK